MQESEDAVKTIAKVNPVAQVFENTSYTKYIK
jgi:ubiquitin